MLFPSCGDAVGFGMPYLMSFMYVVLVDVAPAGCGVAGDRDLVVAVASCWSAFLFKM